MTSAWNQARIDLAGRGGCRDRRGARSNNVKSDERNRPVVARILRQLRLEIASNDLRSP